MPQNLLGHEKSPYLLQHKDNPIAWMAWGEDAFRRAHDEGKPVFLSVGYSTCHWCHVMAHESFEDPEVAAVLNRAFVCIKVDREERPDVDHVYMSVLQAITGGGGWPMSVWMTAEGKPFFAGTYYPKARFLQLLARIEEVWRDDRGQLAKDGDEVLKAIARRDMERPEAVERRELEAVLQAYPLHFTEHFDPLHGGFGGAPKFPQTMSLRVLMRRDPQGAREIVTSTLAHMVRGGICDQLAGGFHRYSVDEEWLVPHFEKMLYDQAMIASTLIEAYQLYGVDEFGHAARATLDYVRREMTHPEGGFYSAQDADSLDPTTGHNEEGYFCTYTYAELKAALTPEELAALSQTYAVTEAGCFEGRNILHLQKELSEAEAAAPMLQAALAKLRQLRAGRPAPHLDDKIIAAWNGWMIAAFAQGAAAFDQIEYLKVAEVALAFVRRRLWQDGGLRRFWRAGGASGAGTAEDFAALIHAGLELQQVNGDSGLTAWIRQLQESLDKKFWSAEQGLYLSDDGADRLLPLRLPDTYDGVTPSANAMAVHNSARLHLLTGDSAFKSQVMAIAGALLPAWRRHPSALSYLALGLDFYLHHPKVAVIAGGGWAKEFELERRYQFLPHWLWTVASAGWPVAADKNASEPTVYICEVEKCLAPCTSRAAAESQLPRAE